MSRISGFSVVWRFYCQKAPIDVSQAVLRIRSNFLDPDPWIRFLKYLNYRGLFVDKGSGIFPDPDLGDPDSQHIIIKNMLIPVHPVLKSCAIFRLLKQF